VLPKPKILIIDDEAVVLDSCTEILAGANYQIATASEGNLGLRLVREFEPDLVFVDLKMPGLPGMGVLEKLRELDPTVVAIVITGYATVNSAVEAMKKGAYDFLPKPFTPDEFRLITRRGLEKRRLVLETIALRREKEILREQFAAIVSHELKAPVSALQQNLFVLLGELAGQITESQRARLERMKVRVDDLLKLIHNWLRVFSVDIDKIKEKFVPVSVSGVVSQAIESVSPQAVRKNIEIATLLEEPSPQVFGDAGALAEAVVNIVGNAVKYSHEGSQVVVKTEAKEERVLLSVTDTGVGIAEEDLPLLLTGFYRTKSAQAAETGSGLGLNISRRIVEAHDGSIEVKSQPGKGSTFVINLPALGGAKVHQSPADAGVLVTPHKGGLA